MLAPGGSAWPQRPQHGLEAGLASPASWRAQRQGLCLDEARCCGFLVPGRWGLGWATGVGVTGYTTPPPAGQSHPARTSSRPPQLTPAGSVQGGHRGSQESTMAPGQRTGGLVRWNRA